MSHPDRDEWVKVLDVDEVTPGTRLIWSDVPGVVTVLYRVEAESCPEDLMCPSSAVFGLSDDPPWGDDEPGNCLVGDIRDGRLYRLVPRAEQSSETAVREREVVR